MAAFSIAEPRGGNASERADVFRLRIPFDVAARNPPPSRAMLYVPP